MDALPGPVPVQLSLKGIGESNADMIRELRAVKDAKPCVDVLADTLSADRASLEKIERCRIHDGAIRVRLGDNGRGLRELAALVEGRLLLTTQNSISTSGGAASEASSCR